MIEPEKVIAGLECCANVLEPCDGCPYKLPVEPPVINCQLTLKRDALSLLKGQYEGVTPIESTIEQKKFADWAGLAVSDFWCGVCHFNLVGNPKFCPNCGKKVKWDG